MGGGVHLNYLPPQNPVANFFNFFVSSGLLREAEEPSKKKKYEKKWHFSKEKSLVY